MGFKDFTAGDVLTANDVDNFLMRQTVMVFDDASERDTALLGILTEGMVVYLKDINHLQKYDGAAFGPVGEDVVLNEGEAGQDVVSDGSAGIRYENSISPFLLLGV
jgi:hypothetical protein